MSRLDDYVAGAISTESTIDQVKVNKKVLTLILKMHIASGNVLDQFKKHAFYGRDYDDQKIEENITNIVDALSDISTVKWADLHENEDALDIDPRLFHAIVGTATEAVELLEALNFDGEEMDIVNMGEEFGDLNWYQAIFCSASGISWTDILNTNAEKLLGVRYEDGFSDEKACERDLDAEREVLDNLKIKSS